MSVHRTTDVAVVGGGAAGALAALAAREAGADVVLVRRSYGATAMSSGCIDLGRDPRRLPGDGFQPQGRPGLQERLEILRRLRPHHPLPIVSADAGAVNAALQLLQRHVPWLAPVPADGPTTVVATVGGTWKETGSGAASIVADGDLLAATARPGGLVVVGLAGLPFSNPAPLARGLQAALAAEQIEVRVEPLTVDVVREARVAAGGAYGVARWLDRDGEGERLGREIARGLRERGGAAPAVVLVPPVLGLEQAATVHAACEQAAGVPCAELAAVPPSVPGLRLQRAIDRALEAAGVAVIEAEVRADAAAAADAREGSRVGSVSLAGRTDGRLVFGQLVLATGKYAAGGIDKAPGGAFRETVLGLTVTDGQGGEPVRDPSLATVASALGEHPLFSYGIRVDAELRPVNPGGAPQLLDVRCSGSLLAGYSWATGGAAMGTALVTGARAGRLAAEAAGKVAAERAPGASREARPRGDVKAAS